MIKQENKGRREVNFQEGDMVYLKLRPHRQNSVCTRIFQKLAGRYYGPFKVIKKVDQWLIECSCQRGLKCTLFSMYHV